ncbi:hypothetical protein HRbin16_02223 [bacterium HR16]|nr:hypothetical protein HRbin16_02223 [bacterium HR16]
MGSRTVQIHLPEGLAEALEQVVRAGWFSSEDEAILHALREFLRREQWELYEQFLLEDIEWATTLKQSHG